MAERRPWFPFYARDWLLDAPVRALTDAERGVYLDLLCWQWVEGGIPSDPDHLCRLLGRDLRSYQRSVKPVVMAFFQPHPDNPRLLVNARLQTIREARDAIASLRAQAGREGAARRWRL